MKILSAKSFLISDFIDYEAVHENPVWRDKANFIIRAHLEKNEGRSEWEQLWALRLDERRFSLCCIPFFAHDLALGDEVETDDDFVLSRVARPAGQTTFRIWFGGQDAETRQELVREIEAMNSLMEWSSGNLLALSVTDGAEAQKLADYLQSREEQGLLKYETSK